MAVSHSRRLVMNLPKLQQPKLQQAIHPFAMKTIHMQLFSHHTQMIKSLPLTFIDPINRMDAFLL